MLVKMTTESKKTPNLSRNFEEKKSLFRLLLLANTFYGCLFKTSNQVENGTIDLLFKMHLVWSLEVPKNKKMFGKSNIIFRKFCLFSTFYFGVFELFLEKIKKKNNFSTKILCFIYFLSIGIDLVPQKTLMVMVI